jgi:hypothetical protein
MRTQTAVLLLGAALVLSAAGCGGGGGVEPGSVPAADAFMPLTTGNWWTYELKAPDTPVTSAQEPVADRLKLTVLGPEAVDGQEWYAIEAVTWVDATGPDHPQSATTVRLRETTRGVYYYEDLTRTGLLWLDKQAAVGAEWQGPAALGIWWKLDALNDTVTAPSEVFTACRHVTEHDPAGSGKADHLYDRWFKQGVGLVLERYFDNPDTAFDDQVLISRSVAP